MGLQEEIRRNLIKNCRSFETNLNIQLQCKERLDDICGVIAFPLQSRSHLAPEDVTDRSTTKVCGPGDGALVPVVHDHLPVIVALVIGRLSVGRLHSVLDGLLDQFSHLERRRGSGSWLQIKFMGKQTLLLKGRKSVFIIVCSSTRIDPINTNPSTLL